MGWGAILAFLPYGDRFRRQRRLVQNHFNQQAVAAYQPVQQKEIYGMVNRLMKTPEEFVHHIHRHVRLSAP
jgi:cytochrome P450